MDGCSVQGLKVLKKGIWKNGASALLQIPHIATNELKSHGNEERFLFYLHPRVRLQDETNPLQFPKPGTGW